jgi:alkanesulfonate monooxygenase SsuD/methylene tetrahydromethanopterin reductase-like flavin-dependent oxidoreductase (luciferase family)
VKDLRQPGLIGIAVRPTAAGVEQILGVAQLADAHGADLLATPDEPYSPAYLDAWTLLTMLAARTERVTLVPDVAALALRPPVMLAKAAVSLQVLTGGRVILGIGAGGPPEDVIAFGGPQHSTAESVSALEEALPLIRRVWTPGAEPIDHNGRFYHLRGARFGPLPATPVPIWVGAFGPRMLALTGRFADGWLPTNAYLDRLKVPAMQRRVDDAAAQAGRDPRAIRRVFNVIGTITDSGRTENGRSLTGPPALWIDALHDYHQRLGFDSFIFWPTSRESLTQARRFFEEVRPRLAGIFQDSPAGEP